MKRNWKCPDFRSLMGCGRVVVASGLVGCSGIPFSTPAPTWGGHDALNFAIAQGAGGMHEGDVFTTPGVRAGEVRVVDAHVNPMVPVRLTVEGDEVAVRFAHSRNGGAVAHLDRTSLAPVGPELPLPAERPAAPSTEAARVVLSDGRSIVCWKSGDFERGYRVMAQAWTGGGEPIGAPVPISPADSDVFGAPQIVSVGGDHAVAAFAVVADDRAEILAVSLQVP